MENLSDIKEDLRHGDYKMIHQMTGVSISAINKMLQGYRNINTPKGERVLGAARQIIKSRSDLISLNT